MNNLQRLAVFLLICALVIALSVSYQGTDILKRAIVLGIGVDGNDNGTLTVTAEIVSPGNGSEQVGTFSKIVSASAHTVAEALQNIAQKTGKETSLGQCVLLVYGEDFVASNFSSAAEYFALSDSFKESAMVCCCKGSAQNLLSQSDAVSQSVSIALAEKLKGLSKEVALPSCDVLTFTRSQQELYQTGFLNYVEFSPSQNTDSEQGDKPQGFFTFDRVAVFKQNKLICLLSQTETQGFALLHEKVSGNTFSVTNLQGNRVTLRVNTKKADYSQCDGSVQIKVDLQVALARNDSFGAGGKFAAKSQQQISSQELSEAQTQAANLAQLFLQKQQQWNFDIIGIHELFRQKYGSSSAMCKLPMGQIPVTVDVSVKEK